MRIRSQISDNGELRAERARSADPRPRTGELKTEARTDPTPPSRKLLREEDAEREISAITRAEGGRAETTRANSPSVHDA